VSHVLQQLVVALWGDPDVRAAVAAAGATYARRRQRLLDCLRARGIRAGAACGLNVWVPVADEAVVIGALLQCGWVLAPGEPYRLPGSAPGVRVTIATLSAQEADTLARDLALVLAPADAVRGG
jgi:DNA-binding transcriptional MocR family regulator